MNKKLVIALGGNALGATPEEQVQIVKETAKSIVDLTEEGYDVTVVHGNGPQVGMINLAFGYSHEQNPSMPSMPFAECSAMSQGYIGFHLQQAVSLELKRRGIERNCVCLITQVEVDRNDPAFSHPVKPIGLFYTEEEVKKIQEEKPDWTFVEDSGRGYRRVVPSPEPQKIVELDAIQMLNEQGCLVIAAGGGGIPVCKKDDEYRGVAAVIDKDRSAARLALDMDADLLLILTAVDRVCINFKKPTQRVIASMNLAEAQLYIDDNQFAAGSMLPKIEACISFVRGSKRGIAIISSLKNAKKALRRETGTWITQ